MINQVAYDFENIRIDIDGFELDFGAKDISYDHGVEAEWEYGSGREPVDETEGTYNVEDPEIVMTYAQYENLRDKIGPGYMTKRKRFDISVTYYHLGQEPHVDVLQRCRIKRVAKGGSQGGDPLEVTCTLSCKKVIENGIDSMAETG